MVLKKTITALLAVSSGVVAAASNSAGVVIDTPLSVANASITDADRFHRPNSAGNNNNVVAVDTLAQKDDESMNQHGVAASIKSPPTSAIPPCEVGDAKTPVPIWKATPDKKMNLPWGPLINDGQIIYIQLSAPIKNEITCNNRVLNSFSIPNDVNDALQGGVSINIRGNTQRKNKMCDFSGFYMNETVFGMHQGWLESYFGAVGEQELASSNRYCLSKLIQKASVDTQTEPPATSAIPPCKPNDPKIAVPAWWHNIDLDAKENIFSAPPMNKGQILHITLIASMADDVNCSDKKLDSFRLPKNVKNPSQGGLVINIKGNNQFANGTCYFSGFYVNKNVRNLRQGWISGQLEPVDKKKMALSDRYCLSK